MSKRMWMALVSLLGLLLGVYLTLYHYGIVGTLACGVSSCETVQTSKWSMFLGLPVATWGAGFYALMLVLCIVGLQERFIDHAGLATVILALAAWGLVFTAWLDSLMAFKIHAWCEWCLGSAAMVVILFVLALLDWREPRQQPYDEPTEA